MHINRDAGDAIMFILAKSSLNISEVHKNEIANYGIDKSLIITFLFMVALITNFSVSATDYNSGSLALTIDNDSLVGTDREYSSGVYLKLFSKSEVNQNKFNRVIRPIFNLLPLHDESQKVWGIYLGQQIWTPTDISIADEVKNDRPYSGRLAMKVHINEYTSSYANKYSLMIGYVGPKSLAEQAQKTIHKFINSPEPMGWDKQINDKLIYSINAEARRGITREAGWFNREVDASYVGRVKISNFQSEIAIGGTARWGANLKESFGSVSAIPGAFIDPSALSTSKNGYFTYLSLEARYRHNDYTIEGGRPEHLYNVSVAHWQSTLATGMVYYKQSWGAACSFAVSTRNFQEDKLNHNTIASLEVFWRM